MSLKQLAQIKCSAIESWHLKCIIIRQLLECSEARSSSCECKSHQQNHPVVAVAMVDIFGGDIEGVCRLYKLPDIMCLKALDDQSFQVSE